MRIILALLLLLLATPAIAEEEFNLCRSLKADINSEYERVNKLHTHLENLPEGEEKVLKRVYYDIQSSIYQMLIRRWIILDCRNQLAKGSAR